MTLVYHGQPCLLPMSAVRLLVVHAEARSLDRPALPRSGRLRPRGWRRTLLWLGLAAGVWLAGATPAVAADGEVQIGQPLRDAWMQGLNGPSHKLSDYLGHPLVINVWASWCGPCRQEMASLERLAWRDHRVAFSIIGISTDDDADSAKRLLEATHATITHFIDHQLVMEHMLGASRLPLTVLIGADGRIVDKVYGAQAWDGPEAAARIDAAFRPAATPARKK